MISKVFNSLKQVNKKDKKIEIAFFPTRVLMQDFTGVPAVADLAAMRNALKLRGIEPKKQISSGDCTNNFDNIRIFESIAELNKDFKSEDVFPHELDSYMNSISNEKGCYPGQEIVSRVYHNRVISKKKFMRLAYTGSPKSQGRKLFQDKKEVGFLGSNANGFCLAYTNREFASNHYEVKHDELVNISAWNENI